MCLLVFCSAWAPAPATPSPPCLAPLPQGHRQRHALRAGLERRRGHPFFQVAAAPRSTLVRASVTCSGRALRAGEPAPSRTEEVNRLPFICPAVQRHAVAPKPPHRPQRAAGAAAAAAAPPRPPLQGAGHGSKGPTNPQDICWPAIVHAHSQTPTCLPPTSHLPRSTPASRTRGCTTVLTTRCSPASRSWTRAPRRCGFGSRVRGRCSGPGARGSGCSIRDAVGCRLHCLGPCLLAGAAAMGACLPARPLPHAGHSLGGALAMLAALQIQEQHPHSQVKLYTWGCPRVRTQPGTCCR